ncbi:MAG: VWA domain-containing protein, partial [Draconibacterium sp.]
MKNFTQFIRKEKNGQLSKTFLLSFILISFILFVSPLKGYSQEPMLRQAEEEFLDLDNIGRPVYIGEVAPFVLPSDYTQIPLKSAKSLKSKSVSANLKSGQVSNPIWPAEGAVHIEKTAEATDTYGKWKVNVLVEGQNIQTTSDIVLVIDDSGSMGDDKMEAAKGAAKDFVDELLTGTTGTRIAVVTINSDAGSGQPEIDHSFSDNITSLKDAIDGIYSDGGTNLQGGFYAARLLIGTSTADKKVIILLSDGAPTYSYDSEVATDFTVTCGTINDFNISRDAFEESHLWVTSSDYTDVDGTGGDFNYTLYRTDFECDGHRFYAGNHGIPTKYEAGLIKQTGVEVYTIGFEVADNGDEEDVLTDCATDPGKYYPANSGNIDEIYSQIRSNIAYAATNAVFTDPMSTYIVMEAGVTPTYSVLPTTTGNVVVSKGTVTFTPNGFVLNDPDDLSSGNSSLVKWKITWNIGTVSEIGDNMYYYVTMAPNTEVNTLYDANEQTYMDYTDVNGDTNAHQQTNEDFTIPKVSKGSGSIQVNYYLVNSSGQPINSLGEVVTEPQYAYRIPQDGNASSYFEFNGSTALELNETYSVSGLSPYASTDGKTYALYNGSSQNFTLTPITPNQTAWFAYTIGCLGSVSITYDAFVCEGSSLQLNAELTDITTASYSWSGPNEFSSDQQNPLVANAASGNYSVTVTYNGGSCTASDNEDITLTSLPNVVAEGTQIVCAGSNIYLYETGGDATSWLWTGPGGYISTDQNPVITTNTGDNYTATYYVTVSDGTCSATDEVTIEVNNDLIGMVGCPTDITVCADVIVDGKLGKYVDWQIPQFGLNCLGDESGSSSFVMGFGLPEVKWACWEFNKVQRVGTNTGVVNLWQSNGTGDPYILSPLVYIDPALDVTIDIYAKTGENFDWTLILVDEDNVEHIVGTTSVTGDNTTKSYIINIPNTFARGAYNLKFKFSENGSGEPSKSVVDNIYFDAIILDNVGCEGGIEFIVEGPVPGFFPIINDSTLTYKATYTPVIGDPVIETCVFTVTVEGVEADVTNTAATCSENNGTLTINATTYSQTPNLQYSLNGAAWTSFSGTSTTLTDLAAGNYTVNVRDLALSGDCEILDILNTTIQSIAKPTVSLADAGPFCVTDGTYQLIGTHSGTGGIESYTGTGVSDEGVFSPVIAGAGLHTITYSYTDTYECTNTTSIIIQVSVCCTLESASAESTPISCFGGTSTVTITAVGGNEPLTYTLYGYEPQTSNVFNSIPAGTYTWSVKETGASCPEITGSVTINEPDLLTASITASTNETCNEDNDGTATVTASGGTTPYSYLWSDSQTTQTAINLEAGSYTVTVTDANGCTVTTDAVTITQPDVLTASITASANETCNEDNDGTATVTAGG